MIFLTHNTFSCLWDQINYRDKVAIYNCWWLVLWQRIELCNFVKPTVSVCKARRAFCRPAYEPKVEAERVMVKYCFESCSECRRLECVPKRGLSWVLRFFFLSPPSKSTEAVRTCLCSGGARFISLPIQRLYSSHSVALIGRNPPNPSYKSNVHTFVDRSYFSVYLKQISHLEGGARPSETSMHILTTPQNTALWTTSTLKSCFWVLGRKYLLAPCSTLRPFP